MPCQDRGAGGAGATLINYTNPAGIVTEALPNETSGEVVGICDTPVELTHRGAELSYLDPAACSAGWSGMNHLGWLTELHETDSAEPLPPRTISKTCIATRTG